MTSLMELRERMKQFYGSYTMAVEIVLKFMLALGIFLWINTAIPGTGMTGNGFLVVLAALICSILPVNATVCAGLVLLVVRCFRLGPEVAGFAFLLLALLFILYIRFTPEDAIVLLLTPLAFELRMPCLIPLGYGLTRGRSTAISAGCGVVVYTFIELVGSHADQFGGSGQEVMLAHLTFLADGILKNRQMMLTMFAFLLVLLLVYSIRKLSVDHARQIAILVGASAYVMILLLGSFILKIPVNVAAVLIGTVGSILGTEILEFFIYHVDYQKTEYLQFSDDRYYYYVKAVPKKIAEPPRAVSTPVSGAGPASAPMPQVPPVLEAPSREEPVDDGYMPEQKTDVDYESRLEDSLKNL